MIIDREEHILGFRQNQLRIRGISCNPQRTYGVSRESPQEFKGPHTLVDKQTYLYQEANLACPLSSRRYSSIGYKDQENIYGQFSDTKKQTRFQQQHQHLWNSIGFKRRKGLLADFFDNNRVMLTIGPPLGFERSSEKRQQTKLALRQSIKKKLKFRKLQKKQQRVSNLFILKSRVRKERNELASPGKEVLQKGVDKISTARSTFYQTIRSSKFRSQF